MCKKTTLKDGKSLDPQLPSTLPAQELGVLATPAAAAGLPQKSCAVLARKVVLPGHWDAGRSHRAHQVSQSGLRPSPQ